MLHMLISSSGYYLTMSPDPPSTEAAPANGAIHDIPNGIPKETPKETLPVAPKEASHEISKAATAKRPFSWT